MGKAMSDTARFVFSGPRTALHRIFTFAFTLLLMQGMMQAASAQAIGGRMPLTLAPGLPARLVYWFSHDSTQTESLPLPAAQNGSPLLLDVPTAYCVPNALLEIEDTEHHKIAHLPVLLGADGGAAPLTERNVLFSSLWSQVPLTAPERTQISRQWDGWLRKSEGRSSRRRSAPDGRTSPNLLRNADFRAGTGQWTLENSHPPARSEMQVLDNPGLPSGVSGRAIRCTVTGIGAESWQTQVFQEGVNFLEGTPYTVSFWAKADHTRGLDVYTSIDVKDWHNAGLIQHAALTTNWKRYVFAFLPLHSQANHNRMTFSLGESLGTIDLAGIAVRAGVDMEAIRGGHAAITNVSAGDFQFAQSVRVPLTYRNQPVTDVSVTLRDQDNTVLGKCYLQAADNGAARFSNVPFNNNLKFSVSAGSQSAEFTRIVEPDKPDTVDSIELPTAWRDVKAAPQPVEPPAVAAKIADEPQAGGNNTLWLALGAVLLIASGIGGYLVLNRKPQAQPESKLMSHAIVPTPMQAAMPSLRFAEPQPVGARNGKSLPESLPESAAPSGQLVAIAGKYVGTTFAIPNQEAAIGRDRSCEVALPLDVSASRRHATIQYRENRPELVDHNSSNGTYINGTRLAPEMPHPVRPGDEIEIGATRFRFES